MKNLGGLFVLLVLAVCSVAQDGPQGMLGSEKEFAEATSKKGIKDAFLEFLSDDAIVFRPNATNGKEFWKSYSDPIPMVLVRQSVDSDQSSNGMLGYTTGNWRLYPKGKSEEFGRYGEYATIWEKRDDKYLATVDIITTHEKLTTAVTGAVSDERRTSDANKNGWSVADASMNFLRASMTKEGLAGAYKKFGSDNMRLLIENAPPLIGKKNVGRGMRQYKSIEFPQKVALFQAADMAYTWNSCQFANSNEGPESGNCLQVWKFHDKKWWIVLSVYARVTNETRPELKVKQKNKKAKT
ncbi:MAG: hypothetical protein ABI878_06690 [Acidobacteriota bacterium]